MKKDGFTIEIKSDALEKQLERALKRNPAETVKVVKTIASDLSTKSAQRAPVESGDLKNNCNADLNGAVIYENQKEVPAVISPSTSVKASVGYSLPYALRQHEDLSLSHDRTDGYRYKSGKNKGLTVNMVAGGEAKYLERPFEENKADYIAQIEEIVEKSLK